MKVLVVGANGNMGARYQAIVRHLGHEVQAVDLPWPKEIEPWDHAIVCTPTPHHFVTVAMLADSISGVAKRHVLIEKPVMDSLAESAETFALCRRWGFEAYVVNQYQYLPEAYLFTHTEGASRYDYFRSGNDGLAWDCFQVFANANGPVELKQESPMWTCVLNGVRIQISGMDRAYVDMVADFLGDKSRLMGPQKALETTKRIEEYLCKRS